MTRMKTDESNVIKCISQPSAIEVLAVTAYHDAPIMMKKFMLPIKCNVLKDILLTHRFCSITIKDTNGIAVFSLESRLAGRRSLENVSRFVQFTTTLYNKMNLLL